MQHQASSIVRVRLFWKYCKTTKTQHQDTEPLVRVVLVLKPKLAFHHRLVADDDAFTLHVEQPGVDLLHVLFERLSRLHALSADGMAPCAGYRIGSFFIP